MMNLPVQAVYWFTALFTFAVAWIIWKALKK